VCFDWQALTNILIYLYYPFSYGGQVYLKPSLQVMIAVELFYLIHVKFQTKCLKNIKQYLKLNNVPIYSSRPATRNKNRIGALTKILVPC
jgi:hypothetical protein